MKLLNILLIINILVSCAICFNQQHVAPMSKLSRTIPTVSNTTIVKHVMTPVFKQEIINLINHNKQAVLSRDSFGRTPLMYATHHYVLPLIEAGVDVNARDNQGMTALMWAAKKNRFKVIEKLIVFTKADLSLRDKKSKTALMHAFHRDARNMLENYAQVRARVFADILSEPKGLDEKLPRLSKIFANTVDINAPLSGRILCKRTLSNEHIRYTPFLWAVGHDEQLTRFLLKKGAQVNSVVDGYTPLKIAALFGNSATAKLLIDSGATVDTIVGTNDYDQTNPLIEAVCHGRHDVVKLLILHGASVNATNASGEYPLMFVGISGSADMADIASLLLASGAAINVRDRAGNTAIDYANRAYIDAIGKGLATKTVDSELKSAYEKLLGLLSRNASDNTSGNASWGNTRYARNASVTPADYALLGLDSHAGCSDIHRAYHAHALKWHPDQHGSESEYEDKMTQINAAYQRILAEKQCKKS